MLALKKKTAELIANAVSQKFGENLLSVNDVYAMLEYPPDKNMGDIALPCFRLSKTLRKAPVQIADAIKEGLSVPEYAEISSVGGYLNFKIDAEAFSRRVVADVERLGDKYGSSMCGVGKTVVID